MSTPEGRIYLTSHHGAAIYVTEDGHFVAEHHGETLRSNQLGDLKRKIKGQRIVPLAFLTPWDVKLPKYYRRTDAIIGMYGGSKERVYDGRGSVWDIGSIYHFDGAVMEKAVALGAESDRLQMERDALVKELRPITADDLKAVTP